MEVGPLHSSVSKSYYVSDDEPAHKCNEHVEHIGYKTNKL